MTLSRAAPTQPDLPAELSPRGRPVQRPARRWSRRAAGRGPRPPHRRLLRWTVRVFAAVVTVVVVMALGLAILLAVTPGVGDASARLAARLAPHGASDPQALPVPDRIGQAVIATEDARFYQHSGVDPLGLLRAALGPLLGGGDQGGATLDQQLVKELYTPNRRGLAAKLEDVGLALKLDHSYSKARILGMYLAAAYYGHGFYGDAQASRGYFGVAPADLSWGQAALIAGLVQAPSAFDPTRHASRARAKEQHVLNRLVAVGTLTKAQAAAAFAAPLRPVVPFRG